MAYTTQADLEARYGTELLQSLTDKGATATGQIDAQTVTAAIDDAGSKIDGFIGRRYRLPLAVTPPLIAQIARHLAIYNLHSFDVSPKIEADFKAAMSMLKQISEGVVTIEADGIVPPSTGGGGARVTDRDRPMTEASLKGFI